MKEVSQGETKWCETLYESKAAELILLGRALGLTHSEAEDVLHETFAAMLQRSEPPEKPEHYCVRSFRNQALNYRRGLARRSRRELESRRWFETPDEIPESEGAAMRYLARLPCEQCEVIVLKIWHRHTFEEIGQLLDLSPNTAAGRYRYGLRKLNALLLTEKEIGETDLADTDVEERDEGTIFRNEKNRERTSIFSLAISGKSYETSPVFS